MNINFSDQNCLTRYNSEHNWGGGGGGGGETGPDVQNIGHTDVLINDNFFVSANTCMV